MRVLVTSDLHFDHGRSRHLADEAADQINRLEYDALLLVGDTATSRGDALEQGLARFTFPGPKLLTFGNHELWSSDQDSLELYETILPRRVANAGWHCLDVAPWRSTGTSTGRSGDIAIVGSVGWYDFSFAPKCLNVPDRFYRAKIAPGSASYYESFRHLFDRTDDIPPAAMDIVARWNDGRYVRWNTTDEGFLAIVLERLERHLAEVSDAARVLAAVHHVPHADLLPPPSSPAWDFAKAYLGSPKLGELLLRFPNVTHVFSGHSHFPASAEIDGKRFVGSGSGYRQKRWEFIDL